MNRLSLFSEFFPIVSWLQPAPFKTLRIRLFLLRLGIFFVLSVITNESSLLLFSSCVNDNDLLSLCLSKFADTMKKPCVPYLSVFPQYVFIYTNLCLYYLSMISIFKDASLVYSHLV